MSLAREEIIDLHERLARNLDWNLLRIFIAIVHYGGISRAAEQIYVSQPAVSQSLKKLERHLGLRLIERNARRFDVTDVGHLVYAKAIQIHNQITRLGDIASLDKKGVSGFIRILFASRLKCAWLDDMLRQFMRDNPDVTIRIDVDSSNEIHAMIQQGTACAGFCLVRTPPKGLRSELYMRQSFGLYCGPDHVFWQKTNIKPTDLKHHDLITYPSDHFGGVLSPLAVYREQHAFEGRVVATSFSLDEIIRMTELGVGVGLLPRHIANELVAANRLWSLPPKSGIGPIDIFMLWNPATEMSAAESAFVDFALEHLGRVPLSERAAP